MAAARAGRGARPRHAARAGATWHQGNHRAGFRRRQRGAARRAAAAARRGRRIVILRGEGGRSLLGDTLAARGARVEYAECYRRVRPQSDSASLPTAFAKGAVHAVTVSSAAGLENLFAMLGAAGRENLRLTRLFVPHPRVAAEARRLGLGEANVGGASDEEMLERLVAYFRPAE